MRRARWNPKLAGERAESAFLFAAMQRGFTVSKPFGDSAPYDFIVDPAPGREPRTLWRVQVKSSSGARSGGYSVCTRHAGGRPLKEKDADFLVAWIVPLDVWYVIPVRELHEVHGLTMFPGVQGSWGRFEKFRNAWHLLKRSASRR